MRRRDFIKGVRYDRSRVASGCANPAGPVACVAQQARTALTFDERECKGLYPWRMRFPELRVACRVGRSISH